MGDEYHIRYTKKGVIDSIDVEITPTIERCHRCQENDIFGEIGSHEFCYQCYHEVKEYVYG